MSFDTKFSQEITNFQRYGTYSYKYDEVGNVVFDSSSNDFSNVFLAFPLPNFSYDESKILSFYNPEFTEFIPPTHSEKVTPEIMTQMQKDLESERATNDDLTKQLDELILVNESMSSLADRQAAKQVILELRKALGQGRIDSDFSEDFPYSPLRKETSLVQEEVTSAFTAPEPTVNTTTTVPATEVSMQSVDSPATGSSQRTVVQGRTIGKGRGPLRHTTEKRT